MVDPDRRSGARTVAAALAGAAAIAVAARVTVPMEPVPTTLQTLAVLLAGGLGGPAVGFGAAVVYLLAALAGAPVLADGRSAPGAALLDLRSGGYVLAFVPAGALAGLVPRRFSHVALRMLAAHALILGVGGLWLARFVGVGAAIEAGVRPFLLGAFAKSLAAATIVVLLRPPRRGEGR